MNRTVRTVARAAASLWALALVACCAAPPPPVPPAGASPATPPVPTAALVATAGAPPTLPACRLPAPVKGPDACAADADCGPSDPCHAHACVARARSRPPTPDTMCTMMMDCASTDANHCGCLEGRCALVPGK
jgi:hypothetical protein